MAIARPIVLIQGEAPLETICQCLTILYQYALEQEQKEHEEE